MGTNPFNLACPTAFLVNVFKHIDVPKNKGKWYIIPYLPTPCTHHRSSYPMAYLMGG